MIDPRNVIKIFRHPTGFPNLVGIIIPAPRRLMERDLIVAIVLPHGEATTVPRPSRTPPPPFERSLYDIERGCPTLLPSINSRLSCSFDTGYNRVSEGS
jgi:hypothetical protein